MYGLYSILAGIVLLGVAAAAALRYTPIASLFGDDTSARQDAEKNRLALIKATGTAIDELNTFYTELGEVVVAFNQKHILFGDRYLRFKFRLIPVRLPMDYRVKCAQLRIDSDLYVSRTVTEDVVHKAEIFHDFVMEHNYDALIRFLGYDNSVRKLMSTLDEVHLRQLVTLVSGGEAGGSPLGVNMLIHDFDNVCVDFRAQRQGFVDLKKSLEGLKLKKPLNK